MWESWGWGYDMILGVDWLKNFNPILFYFKELGISITKQGELVTLKGIKEEVPPIKLCSN